MTLELDRIYQGDCLKLLAKLDEGSVDLAFVHPPGDAYITAIYVWLVAVAPINQGGGGNLRTNSQNKGFRKSPI